MKFPNNTLKLVAKVDLPVNGRIDHITYDETDHLAFVAALGNNTVEVVNINTQKIVYTITGLHAPQGIAYIPSLKRLVVANDEGGEVNFYDATNFKMLSSINLKDDADNIRYDGEKNLVYVGYGSGGIAVIDANTMKEVANILLDGHPESFQISKKQNRLFVNVPDRDEIEVADLTSQKVIAKWKNISASSNFPMALDDEHDRLFIAYRSPSILNVVDARTGKQVQSLNCSGDADDVFYDASNNQIYLSGGKGFIDVFKTNSTQINLEDQIETSKGARTSLLIPSEKKLLLAVPAHGSNSAGLWIYAISE